MILTSTEKRAILIFKETAKYYETGTQSKCKCAVFRRKIAPVFGISQRTFFKYLLIAQNKLNTTLEQESKKIFT